MFARSLLFRTSSYSWMNQNRGWNGWDGDWSPYVERCLAVTVFFTFNISIYTQTLNMLAFVASTCDWKYASNTCTRAVSMIVWWNWSIFSFSSHRHQCNVLFSKYYCFGDNRANIRFFLTYIVYCELMRWQRNTASHTNHSEMLLFVFNERKRWTYFLGLWWNMIN